MERRSRKGLTKEFTHIGELKGGQLLTVIPHWLVEKKDIAGSTLLRWSDAGPGWIKIEIINNKND